jgi:hypothetical protein
MSDDVIALVVDEYDRVVPVIPLAVTSEDMIALHELIAETNRQVRLFAEAHHTRGAWGAVSSLESAMYYVWGAMGYLARAEGRLGPDKAEPGFHVQLPEEQRA